jgi:hypothetical protein
MKPAVDIAPTEAIARPPRIVVPAPFCDNTVLDDVLVASISACCTVLY